jgi:hypothetical protein
MRHPLVNRRLNVHGVLLCWHSTHPRDSLVMIGGQKWTRAPVSRWVAGTIAIYEVRTRSGSTERRSSEFLRRSTASDGQGRAPHRAVGSLESPRKCATDGRVRASTAGAPSLRSRRLTNSASFSCLPIVIHRSECSWAGHINLIIPTCNAVGGPQPLRHAAVGREDR